MSPRSKLSVALALGAAGSLATAAPCDIYASGKTPCVAAHSTTRALYSAYAGPLYQVKRGSDGATSDIKPLTAGGVANAATQDSFCKGTTCLISIIYDQSSHGNHLSQAPPGGAAKGDGANGYDELASAIGAPVTLDGHKAYGVFIQPGAGYRVDKTKSITTGDGPQGIYAVLDGTHYNERCCFDYGNAETNNDDTGNGHMETIYFGKGDGSGHGTGSGSGPWVMADLENGLFSGYDPVNNPANPTISDRFVTAIVKGKPNHWAIRGGNAASGDLSSFYNGTRPNKSGYNPMHREGAIILGVGGDNSDWAQGTFYEGVMTATYPSDATENSVQANIVAAKYAAGAMASGPAMTVGSSIAFRVTTRGYTTRYLAHSGATVNTQVVSSSSSNTLKEQASWIVRTGLGNSACLSFESKDTPGSFIRHSSSKLQLDANDGTQLMHEDATFCPQAGLNGKGNTLRSWNYPTRFFRHYDSVGYAAANGGPNSFDTTYSFIDDVSWMIEPNFNN